MTNSFHEFIKYLNDTFGEEFDDCNIDHLTKLALFEAGWDANNPLSLDDKSQFAAGYETAIEVLIGIGFEKKNDAALQAAHLLRKTRDGEES